VKVPRLSELRKLAGCDAFVTNPAEAIRKMQASGVDPAGERCLLCCSTAAEFYGCDAVCESSHVKRPSSNYDPVNTVLTLISWRRKLSYLFSLFSEQVDEEPERRGHDIQVSFTLPVCRACQATAGNVTRPKVAKRLMANVPVLAELMDFYPQLTVNVRAPRA
jgi:hypothetical protein